MGVVDQKQEEVKKREVARQRLAGVKKKVELQRQEVQLEVHQRLVEVRRMQEVQPF
jgi:hypothetical protein